MGMQKNPQTTQSLKIHKAKTDRTKNTQYVENFKTPFSVIHKSKSKI